MIKLQLTTYQLLFALLLHLLVMQFISDADMLTIRKLKNTFNLIDLGDIF